MHFHQPTTLKYLMPRFLPNKLIQSFLLLRFYQPTSKSFARKNTQILSQRERNRGVGLRETKKKKLNVLLRFHQPITSKLLCVGLRETKRKKPKFCLDFINQQHENCFVLLASIKIKEWIPTVHNSCSQLLHPNNAAPNERHDQTVRSSSNIFFIL